MRRLIGVSALFFGLGLYGCSSQQQEEEGLEVTDQENVENTEGENAEGNVEENGEVAEGNVENNTEGEQYTNENGEDTADAGDATENDLQEIIQEMNGQQMADTGDAETGDATALEQDASMAGDTGMGANAMATTPTNTAPMNTAPAAATSAPVASNPPPFQPGGSPAAQGLPEIGSKMAYIVEAGDTLGKISTKIYGSPGRWNELATLSGIANPSRIYPGDLVYYTLDESAVAFATAYESIQKTSENVQQGDTLATIAQRIYGSSKAWRSLWRHNDKIDNPDVLTVSTVYYVPKGASTAAVSKIKANIAKVSKESIEKTKEVVKSVAKTANSVKVSVSSIDLSAALSIKALNGNYAAI